MSWFDTTRFDHLAEEAGLKSRGRLHLLDSTTSTNDEALEAVSAGAPEWSVWIAREQTQGRGRRGNTWAAAPGECLMLSTVLAHRGETERMMGLSLVVGLALRDAVQARLEAVLERGCLAQIKWPNDVLVSGKKLAGILVETRSAPDGALGIVIGVGLNVETAAFPVELPDATSLKSLGVPASERGLEALTVDFLAALEKKSRAFFGQDFSPFLPELVEADYLHERRIRVGKVEGWGAGFDTGGRLLISDATGNLTPVMSGHVEFLQDGE